MRRLGALVVLSMFAGAGGCNSSAVNVNGNGDGGNGNPGSDGGNGGGDAGNGTGTVLPPGSTLGTYIPLGDSISDRGGTGPFFYDLLNKNDDAAYPAFKGHDLSSKFPGLRYEHDAVGGAITDTYSNGGLAGSPTLKSQIDALGHSYPGDVLITITIGGNDMQGHAFEAINGTDGPARMEYAQHLADELGALKAPGRLGSGKVYIVLANVYDFTDGQGDFATVACGPPVNVMPARDAAVFTAWNGVSADAIGNAGGTLYDMHADFKGHGYNNTDVWYDRSSCIHPNAAGHAEIRKSIWKLVTGESP